MEITRLNIAQRATKSNNNFISLIKYQKSVTWTPVRTLIVTIIIPLNLITIINPYNANFSATLVLILIISKVKQK